MEFSNEINVMNIYLRVTDVGYVRNYKCTFALRMYLIRSKIQILFYSLPFLHFLEKMCMHYSCALMFGGGLRDRHIFS